MTRNINKYESRLAKLLAKLETSPIDPSTKFTTDRMTEGLAVTGLESRLSEIDGNPELGKRIASTISSLPTDINTLNPASDSLESRLNKIFNIQPVNTAPPLNIPNLQDESKTSKKFDVQNDYRPIETVEPLPNRTPELKSNKSKSVTIPDPKSPNTDNKKDKTNLGELGTIISAAAPTVFSTIDALLTKKNQNAFADFGRDALNTLDESKRDINVSVNDRLNKIANEAATGRKSIDENTTSLNVGRALKSGVFANQLQAENDIIVSGIDKNSQLNTAIAQAQNQRDQVVMQGNDIRTERDQQDLGAIISNFSASAQSAGKGLEHLQKMRSADTYNDDVLGIINSMFASTELERDANGKLVIKKRIKP